MSSKKIDLTNMSAHVIVDRKTRIDLIERTIGWGTIVVEAPDYAHDGVIKALTSTGVIIIKTSEDFIITTWVADVKQAIRVWKDAKGNKPLPQWLWARVNYNNNTEAWHTMAAA